MASPPPIRQPENYPPPITLTTDFGVEDGYVGTMKGVILDILPWAKIVDISHAIQPQNIHQAAYVLGTSAPYFPRNTVHVVVVDPGVGTERRPIAVFTRRACYIGPDNGVFSRVYHTESVLEIRELSNIYYRLPQVSNTFHGRDVFSPFAAHVAAGAPPHSLGAEVSDPVTVHMPQPERLLDGRLRGQIVHADRFGNLISDIPVTWLDEDTNWMFEVAGRRIEGFSQTYGRVGSGQLIVLGGSEGLVEVAVRNGSAAVDLGIGPGEILMARKMSDSGEG